MLRNFINGLINLVYPKICLLCRGRINKKPNIDELVCLECWGKIKRNLPPFCSRCGRHLEKRNLHKSICRECLKRAFYFDRAFSPCIYEGAVKELIHDFKYKDKEYLGNTLAKLMVEFIRDYNLPIDDLDFIIPVPLHSSRLREREFNQAEILSQEISKSFNKRILKGCLRRQRNTKTQTELEISERILNVKGSFLLKESNLIKNKNLLLVDDVLTTGATCSEAAGVLKKAGAGIIFVLTLAN